MTQNNDTRLVELVESLHAAIQHGDAEHRAWLKEAIDAHFAGHPAPEPRGKGNKEARIESLTAEAERLRELLRPLVEKADWADRQKNVWRRERHNGFTVSIPLGTCRAVRDALESTK